MPKICPRCEVESDDFYPDKIKSDGLNTYCIKCNSERSALRYQKHREETIAKACKWGRDNSERRREIHRKWSRDNLEKKRVEACKTAKKMRSTPKGALNSRMSVNIYLALRANKGGRRWESLVGYTVSDLKEHLEKLFTDGMNWDNRHLWHIDHIKPKAVFDFEQPEDKEFLECWSLSNLQPLWAGDNIKKGAKYAP